MSDFSGQLILAKWKTGAVAADGYVTAPGSGATITIYDSGAANAFPGGGLMVKRLVWYNTTSHDSAASSGNEMLRLPA